MPSLSPPPWLSFLEALPTPISANAPEEGRLMSFDYGLGALATLALLIYLTYALIHPERF